MRFHFLAFGLVGYLAALLPMVYLVGFLANAGVAKSVDSGPAGRAGTALAVDLALLLAFALLHSLLARPAAKARLRAGPPPPSRTVPDSSLVAVDGVFST